MGPYGEYKINSYSMYLDVQSKKLKVNFRYLISTILIVKIPSDEIHIYLQIITYIVF